MNQPMMQSGSSQKNMWMWLVIGAVVIVALAAVWWFWQGGVLGGEDAGTAMLEKQGTSDEVEAIDADLQATDLEDLDAETDAIDAELAR
ncbi:MAG: hypothetical protein Q7R73_02335 [bacterium]|nr:hypothetical protein [bacterium]